MSARPRDDIRVVTEDGEFTAFKTIEIATSFSDVASCTFTFGDDGTYASMGGFIRPGRWVRVTCNGYRVFTGRFEAHGEPINARDGINVSVVARTKLSDARVAGADHALRFRNTSIRAFLIKLFEPLGYQESDFQFSPAAERNLQTGRWLGGKKPADLERAKWDQLRVNPPETIWEVALRVLKRHHMLIWDAGDGRIIVGKPDDTQEPLYPFILRKWPESSANNVLGLRPSVDWSEVPSEIHVHSNTYGRDIRKAPIRGVAVDLDLAAEAARSGHFNRIVYIPNDGARSKGLAESFSRREMATRAKSKHTWEVDVDGWSQWNGQELVSYVINTVADINSDVHPGLGGPFLVHQLMRKLSLEEGARSTLSLVAKGIYDI